MNLEIEYWRFDDLVERRILRNRTTLHRWQKFYGFPKPFRLGPGTAVFRAEDVRAWLAARERGEAYRPAASA